MTLLHREHPMPYGAQLDDGGGVHFRLWAPGAARVDLCLCGNGEGGSTALETMQEEGGGWFAVHSSVAGAGTRYFFRIDGELRVPDPASRYQPMGVHGPSEVIDPRAWRWRDGDWRGLPWEEAVIYELHVGSFTRQGDFAGVRDKLQYLADLGVTALELMPVAAFPGRRNWGYDGTLPFAPDACYGRPEALKQLIEAAHEKGLMVFLDVVYNHFGPEGNYLHRYAPAFFSTRHHTPWGQALNFDGEACGWVRRFFIHNALYWLEEYHLDGLRLDAVHAIMDDSRPDFLQELARHIHDTVGRQRHVHLVLENDHNAAHYLARNRRAAPRWYTAQWNDDLHHCLHVLLTGESGNYYRDYVPDTGLHLLRCLGEGFDYQGEVSPFRACRRRGEYSAHLPPTAFVSFLQNHDQVGNRAFGERLTRLAPARALQAATALLLLAPFPPLLFMGQEWGCRQPFLFFCDFSDKLDTAVREGRRREFASQDPQALAKGEEIPDPTGKETFERCVLHWPDSTQGEHGRWLALHRRLLALRREHLTPRLKNSPGGGASCRLLGVNTLVVCWPLGDGSRLAVLANLGGRAVTLDRRENMPGKVLYSTHPLTDLDGSPHRLPPWSVFWHLDEGASVP